MLRPCPIPSLFITATDTNVGKTVIAAAIASHLHSQGKKITVSKPIATGCSFPPSPCTQGEGRGGGSESETRDKAARDKRNTPYPDPPPEYQGRELFSEDAQFLSHHAQSPFALEMICPIRYRDPLAPAVAAARENRPINWPAIQDSLDVMTSTSDAIIIEGVGGVLVPLDSQHTVLDMIKWLGVPAIVVARPSLGTINHTLLTLLALRGAHIPIAGVIINRMPANPDLAEQTNLAAIEKYGQTKILAIIPETSSPLRPQLPSEILSPISRIDFTSLLAPRRGEAAG